MGTIFDAADRERLYGRFAKLTPAAAPAWGKMNAPQMVAHCTEPIKASLGEVEVSPKPGPLRNPVLRYLVIKVLPWPKGVPTAPEFIDPPAPADWNDRVKALRDAVERLATRGPDGKYTSHAAFGDMPGPLLGYLIHRHLDHHLRQFGV